MNSSLLDGQNAGKVVNVSKLFAAGCFSRDVCKGFSITVFVMVLSDFLSKLTLVCRDGLSSEGTGTASVK